MAESFNTKLLRWSFNLFPAYRRSGGRVTFVDDSFLEVKVKIPLNWKTKNYLGTTYGGTIYSAVDPIYAVMLLKILGPDTIIWVKEAHVSFKRPGKTTLFGCFKIEQEEVDFIKKELDKNGKVERTFTVDLTDCYGDIYATIEKVLHIRKGDRKNV